MRNKRFYKIIILTLIFLISGVFSNEDPLSTVNATHNPDLHFDRNGEQVFSSTISEKIPDAIGMPQSEEKPHHHQKHRERNPTDGVQSHTRSPVYEVINQPCYSPGCGGYRPQDGYIGNRWQPGRNRGSYPKYFEPRRRGGYREMYPAPGYGPNYGTPYPDYGYTPRGIPFYPQDRLDRFGGYGRPPYDDYFLG